MKTPPNTHKKRMERLERVDEKIMFAEVWGDQDSMRASLVRALKSERRKALREAANEFKQGPKDYQEWIRRRILALINPKRKEARK